MSKTLKLSVVSHIDDAVGILSKLASLGVFHPERTDRLKNDLVFSETEILADLIVKLEHMREELEPYFVGDLQKQKTLPLKDLIEASKSFVDDFSEKVSPVLSQIREAELKKLTLKEDLKMVSNFGANVNFGPLSETKASFISGKMPSKTVKHFRLILSERLPKSILVSGPWEGGWDYVLIGTSEEDTLEGLLSEFTWIPLYLPKMRGTVAEFRDSLLKENQDLDKELISLNASLSGLTKKIYPELIALREMLNNYYQVLSLSKYAKKSEFFTLIEGWTLEKDLSKLKDSLKKIDGVEIFLENFDPKDAPTMPNHPKAVDPFYSIVSLMGPSSQGSIDPTLTVSLFFPLFFGMMLGDIGYGTIMLLLAVVFKKQVDSLFDSLLGKYFSRFSWVLMVSGISSIMFGFFFGEVFGFSITPLFFNRLENIETLLLSAFIIGLIHLNLGFLMKAVEDFQKGLPKLVENLSWILLQIGAFTMFINFNTGLALTLISFVFLLRGDGLESFLMVFILFGNIFSYLRLAAIGLSSVGIALAVNQLAGMAGSARILVLLFGHTLTLIIGIFAPFIQAMRLHLIEFFTKFYEVGKRVFSPLKLTYKYSGGELKW